MHWCHISMSGNKAFAQWLNDEIRWMLNNVRGYVSYVFYFSKNTYVFLRIFPFHTWKLRWLQSASIAVLYCNRDLKQWNKTQLCVCFIFLIYVCALAARAVRRRTGGRRRRWVVLSPAAAAHRAFFIGGGGVGGVRPDERALKQRTRWTGVFFWFYRGQTLRLWSPLGRWRRRLWICMLFVQFHSRNELIVHCLISWGIYKCNVECWGDADIAEVENAELENAGLENAGLENTSINKICRAMNGWTYDPEKAVQPSLLVARFVIPVAQ